MAFTHSSLTDCLLPLSPDLTVISDHLTFYDMISLRAQLDPGEMAVTNQAIRHLLGIRSIKCIKGTEFGLLNFLAFNTSSTVFCAVVTLELRVHLTVTGQACENLLLRLCTFCSFIKTKYLQTSLVYELFFSLPLTCCFSSPFIQHMTLAKMSVYKRMKLACCFDCGRSERDCSCMAGSVHSNMDSLQRAFPLSSVSVHDCSTSLRACKFDRQPHVLSCFVTCVCVCDVFHVLCFIFFFFFFSLCTMPSLFPSPWLIWVCFRWVWCFMDGYDFLYSGRVVVVVLWLLCDSAAAVGGRRVVACCVSGALVVCCCLHSHCSVLRTTMQVNVSVH